MAKYNVPEKNEMTLNHEGNIAYNMQWKIKLATEVLTTFMFDGKFYDSEASKTIIDLIRDGVQCDPLFVAKLGIYARQTFNLRSVSHVIFAELAHGVKSQEYTKDAIAKGIMRVDDMTEIMAYYIKTYGKPIPNCLKKGMNKAANQFSAYQFAKYNRDGLVTLQDLFNLCHPCGMTLKAQETFKQVITNTLPTPETWETYLSAHGNNCESWEHLIENNSLGYMAMLRNLRNILEADVSMQHLNAVITFLTNEVNVRNSKQLPFRFLSAYQELEKLSKNNGYDYSYGYTYESRKAPIEVKSPEKLKLLMSAVEKALEASAENIDFMPGNTVIAIDSSGSMGASVSNKSTTTVGQIANLMGAICAKRCEHAIIIHFDDNARITTFNTKNTILQQATGMPSEGGSTNLIAPICLMIDKGIIADRVIYLSDNEINCGFEAPFRRYWECRKTALQTVWNEYKKTINPNAWMHAIDIVGSGTQQVKGDRTNILAGWSDRIFDFINLCEKGFGSIVQVIDEVKI